MVKRKSISFDDDIARLVEDWRRKQQKIPSFSRAINTLVKKALNSEVK